jgi:hypothetical protein
MAHYWKRFAIAFWNDSVPWARDNIVFAAIALIVPALVVHLRYPNQTIDWAMVTTALGFYATALVIYFLAVAVRTPKRLDSEIQRRCEELQARVNELEAMPPEISLEIQDVVMHRTGDGDARFRYGEFLIQASAQSLKTAPVAVSYSAQLVFRGTVIELERLDDLERWEIIERRYYQNLGSRARQDFVTDPEPLNTILTTTKSEGWLHFRVDGMREMAIAKHLIRLYANAQSGSRFTDRELAQDHVVKSELVAMRKSTLR